MGRHIIFIKFDHPKTIRRTGEYKFRRTVVKNSLRRQIKYLNNLK
jgi:hypothetical protein